MVDLRFVKNLLGQKSSRYLIKFLCSECLKYCVNPARDLNILVMPLGPLSAEWLMCIPLLHCLFANKGICRSLAVSVWAY